MLAKKQVFCHRERRCLRRPEEGTPCKPQDERFVDVDGIRTRYFEKGTGENLVLIHGGVFGSNDAADCSVDWALNFDALAQWFHVYALDKLGQGLTDNPPTDADYTMAATTRHAIGFVEALGLRGVHVVGHSRGAYVAARMTLERPDLVRSCIPVDTNTLAPGFGRNHIVFADTPEPRLSRESQRWVLERYSYSGAHVSDDWLDVVTEMAQLPKYRESVEKMITPGPAAEPVPDPALDREGRDPGLDPRTGHGEAHTAGVGLQRSHRHAGTGNAPVRAPVHARAALTDAHHQRGRATSPSASTPGSSTRCCGVSSPARGGSRFRHSPRIRHSRESGNDGSGASAPCWYRSRGCPSPPATAAGFPADRPPRPGARGC